MACIGKSNTTGGTSWAGTVNPSRAPKSTHILCCSIFGFLYSVLYIIVCPFVLFLLAISLSVLLQFTSTGYPLWYLRFTASDYLLWYLRFTASDYPLWYLRFMACDYPLWYFRFTASDYPPFGIFKLFLQYDWLLWTFLIMKIYSQTCIKMSPLGQRKCGLIRQVTS